MLEQIYYLIRSKRDGKYLTARIKKEQNQTEKQGYLLMFKEHFDALSYLNTHAVDLVDNFGVESVSGTQLKGLLQRWGFNGIGIVQDPLQARIEFLSTSKLSY